MNKDTKVNKPSQRDYDIMKSAFAEVMRLAEIGAATEVKLMKGSEKKRQKAAKSRMMAMGVVGTFINGIEAEYNKM